MGSLSIYGLDAGANLKNDQAVSMASKLICKHCGSGASLSFYLENTPGRSHGDAALSKILKQLLGTSMPTLPLNLGTIYRIVGCSLSA